MRSQVRRGGRRWPHAVFTTPSAFTCPEANVLSQSCVITHVTTPFWLNVTAAVI